MTRIVAALLGALLALSGCSAQGAADKRPDTLPAVTLESLDNGPSLDLSTVRGPAVINVWASWCGPCRKELPHYQSFAQKYAGQVKVIGIDFQDTQVGKARELIRQTGVRFPLYRDPDGAVRARVLPQVLLVDEKGRVAYKKYVEIASVAQLEKLVEKHLGTTS